MYILSLVCPDFTLYLLPVV